MKNKLLPLVLSALFFLSMSCEAQIVTGGKRQINTSETTGISALRQMKTSRAAHTAVLLDTGKVLIAGGFSDDKTSLASTEIFDPSTNNFSNTNDMSVSRAGHTATLLPDGNVLIAGGFNGDYLDSAEIYNTKTGKFTAAGKMTLPRSEHIAVLLNNGKVLLAGGVGTGWTFLADAEIYDPATNTFTKTGNMLAARESHTATLLNDGRVLITGGHKGRRSAVTIYQSAEIFDPAKGTFSEAGNLTVKRHKHSAVLLNDGRVLIVGGSDERDSSGAYSTAEIYDPKTKIFAKTGDMNLSRYKLNGTSILLNSGKILIAGGADRAEIFDPANETFDIAAGKFETMRLFATATLLQNGRVLIAGGYDNNNDVSSQAWIFMT